LDLAENAQPRPLVIGRLSNSIYPASAMLAGMQLELFTALAAGPATGVELARRLGVGADKLSPLLYTLAGAELLTLADGMFTNSPEAAHFLVKGAKSYIGGAHELYADLWHAVLKTAATIRAGAPQARHDFSAMDRASLAAFFRGLHPLAVSTGIDLARRFDLSQHRALLEIGGGSGGVTIALCGANPALRGTLVDLPSVVPIAAEFIGEAGLADRVTVQDGDIVAAPPSGRFDLAVARALIQVLGPLEAERAIRHIAATLTRGGSVYIMGHILDDSRLAPAETLGLNLAFLNLYEGGRAYTESEYRAWCESAGLEGFTRLVLPNGSSIAHASKPT
jgi:O-methyltransferase domain/Dimerisation domain